MSENYENKQRRWYDKDPILSRSMRTLEASDDETQIKVALNLIKIIVEHNLAFSEYTDVNEIIDAVEEGMDTRANSRWYDIDRTVRAAINMLQNSPASTQKMLAKEMAKIVIDKIKEDKDIEELKKELEQDDTSND
ncbi:MAG: hypothetical protein LUG16_06455 [Candidatus Gastranaerophilales bacterium]|nr:hypothetical protein [Candidatus Gastranaerophilales bacterium]